MENQLKQLVEISRLFGNNKDYITAGGGNTSVKNENFLWVKASGVSLATITEKGFVKLNRNKLKEIAEKTYSEDVHEREFQVKTDLGLAIADPESGLRPSVESSLHDCLEYTFVVHTHPTLYNALLCGKDSKKLSPQIFGDDSLYIPYIDPGYTLFKVVEAEIKKYREQYGYDPKVLLLENHGIFVSANDIEEIKEIYNRLESKLKGASQELVVNDLPIAEKASKILPAIRMILSKDTVKLARIVNNSLVAQFYSSHNEFRLIAHPFTPDMVVYCKSKYIYIDSEGSAESIIENFKNQLERFVKEYGYQPKVVVIKNLGFIVVEENIGSLENLIDVYQDLMKVSYYSQSFGGPRFLSPEQIAFIDQWEVENYRRKVSKGSQNESPVANKIIAITGAAQGFGAGIAEKLAEKGANLVIADINEEKGKEFAEQLSKINKSSRALFVKTNVTDPESVRALIHESVCYFGGLDVFISNAGVLRAGGLEEMDVDSFDFVTDVNYKGYFVCAKYASEPMKIQHEHNKNYYADIIQVNSKSGLKGSNRNFAYAGGKFGGIGLTQSFALELVPYNIKVNSICPGNFFDGPLWSDPKNGLFVQYLNAGKVPGAQNLEDVKNFYSGQVPMGRGCEPDDVLKAILYVIDQKYETGQAVPVTGGQNMLK